MTQTITYTKGTMQTRAIEKMFYTQIYTKNKENPIVMFAVAETRNDARMKFQSSFIHEMKRSYAMSHEEAKDAMFSFSPGGKEMTFDCILKMCIVHPIKGDFVFIAPVE